MICQRRKEIMAYFDTHAHYRRGFPSKKHRDFHQKVSEILKTAHENGVKKIMNVGLDVLMSEYILHDFKNYPWNEMEEMPEIYFAVGEHPRNVKGEIFSIMDREDDLKLQELCKDSRVRAIKTGLDHTVEYHRYARQEKRFRDLIRLSKKTNLPLILHVRDAYSDAIRILDEESEGKKYCGVVHCFCGSLAEAKEYVKRGFLLGIGGKITHTEKEELEEAVREISIEHLVLETDCPYIRLKGGPKMSTSSDLPAIAKSVWEIKKQAGFELTLEEMEEIMYANSELLFEKKGS